MLSCSADVRYIVDTPYASIHLANAFRNLTAFYQTQFGLAILLVVVMVVRILVANAVRLPKKQIIDFRANIGAAVAHCERHAPRSDRAQLG